MSIDLLHSSPAPRRAEILRTCRVAVLALVVLLGNFSLLWHQYDLAQHAAGDYCTTCVAAHALDHGIAAQVEFANVPELPGALPTPHFTVSFSQISRVYRARAPPAFLPS